MTPVTGILKAKEQLALTDEHYFASVITVTIQGKTFGSCRWEDSVPVVPVNVWC